MNLELPLYELPDAELDAYLAKIDAELDALFLADVEDTLEAIRATLPSDDVAASAA